MKNDYEVNEQLKIKLLRFWAMSFQLIDSVATLRELIKILKYIQTFNKLHTYF